MLAQGAKSQKRASFTNVAGRQVVSAITYLQGSPKVWSNFYLRIYWAWSHTTTTTTGVAIAVPRWGNYHRRWWDPALARCRVELFLFSRRILRKQSGTHLWSWFWEELPLFHIQYDALFIRTLPNKSIDYRWNMARPRDKQNYRLN